MKKLIDKIKNKEEKVNLPFGSEECGKFLKNTYKNSVDEVVILNDNLYDKFSEYDEIVSSIKSLEARKKTIEHIIQSEMKNSATAFCKERKITWKSVVKSSVDTKKLKFDHPEIVNNYTKISSSRMFKIK